MKQSDEISGSQKLNQSGFHGMPQGSSKSLKWWVCCRCSWCQDDILPPIVPQMEDGWTWGFWKMSLFSKKIGNCFPMEQGDLLRKKRDQGEHRKKKNLPTAKTTSLQVSEQCCIWGIILPKYLGFLIGHYKDLYETTRIHLGKLTWQWNMDHLNMYFLLKKGTVYCHLSPPEGLIKCHNSFETLAWVIPWPLGGWVRG